MNSVLENDGNRAILRIGFEPLAAIATENVYASQIGIISVLYRTSVPGNVTKEQFKAALPVGDFEHWPGLGNIADRTEQRQNTWVGLAASL